jgi:uncharacterized lipoprotein YddW (UPF0748 family)
MSKDGMHSFGCAARVSAYLAAAALAVVFTCNGQALAAGSPELRAIWINLEPQFRMCAENPDQGRQAVRTFVDNLADSNFNVIFAWVLSTYAPAVTNAKFRALNPAAGCDALGEMVAEAKTRGIQVHLWVSVTQYKQYNSPEFNPALGGNPQWAARPAPGQGSSVPYQMCLIRPDARAYELKLIKQLLDRYPYISGVQIEEAGYETPGYCSDNSCLLYASRNSPGKSNLAGCAGINAFMIDLRHMLNARTPKIILTTDGGDSIQRDLQLGRNWAVWARQRLIDGYAAELYSLDAKTFQQRTTQIMEEIGSYVPVFIGIGAQFGNDRTNTVPAVLTQVSIARQAGAKGIVFFWSGRALPHDYLAALKSGPFAQPATLPFHR